MCNIFSILIPQYAENTVCTFVVSVGWIAVSTRNRRLNQPPSVLCSAPACKEGVSPPWRIHHLRLHFCSWLTVKLITVTWKCLLGGWHVNCCHVGPMCIWWNVLSSLFYIWKSDAPDKAKNWKPDVLVPLWEPWCMMMLFFFTSLYSLRPSRDPCFSLPACKTSMERLI